MQEQRKQKSLGVCKKTSITTPELPFSEVTFFVPGTWFLSISYSEVEGIGVH